MGIRLIEPSLPPDYGEFISADEARTKSEQSLSRAIDSGRVYLSDFIKNAAGRNLNYVYITDLQNKISLEVGKALKKELEDKGYQVDIGTEDFLSAMYISWKKC